MLFEFADDLAVDLNDREVSALELILQARRSGFHILMGSDEVFGALLEVEGLSLSARQILGRARRRQIQKGELLRVVRQRVRITHNTGPQVDRVSDSAIVTLPLQHFSLYSAPDQPVVLGENVRDAHLATEMARYYAATRGLAGVKLRCRPDGGGGTTTAEAFRSYRKDPRFCICVVDSDCLAPGTNEGTTAAAVRAEVDPNNPWAIVLTIPCREAENTLPTRVVYNALGSNEQHRRLVPQLERLSDGAVLESVRDHCDLKKGTRLKSVFEVDDEAAQEYWREAMASIAKLPGIRSECVEAFACSDERACSCWIVRGFGRTLLKSSLATLREMSTDEIGETLCDATRPHWMTIGRMIFSWVCGTEKVRV